MKTALNYFRKQTQTSIHVSAKKVPEKQPGYRQVMAEVHTWFGLLLGWLLFFIFALGAVSFFNKEISQWMQPDIPAITEKTSLSNATPTQKIAEINQAVSKLQANKDTSKSWVIEPSSERTPFVTVFMQGDKRKFETKVFDPTNQQFYTARDTQGGDFLYRLHYNLYYVPYPYSRLIVGFATMMMLIAMITGIIVHKKIFTDFFTFRKNKGQRSWLDAHNGFSVLALPFHLMITFTGIISLIGLYMPWGLKASGVNSETMYQSLFSYRSADTKNAQPAPMTDIGTLLTQTQNDWSNNPPNRYGQTTPYTIARVRINAPNTDKAQVIIDGLQHQQLSGMGLYRIYDGVTGKLVQESQPAPNAVMAQQVMIGIHAGRFADIGLRWVYFVLGLAGCGMIASGLVLWLVKRRRQLPNPLRPYFSFWLVERLNIATMAGLPLAIIGYFWLNRLLPVTMAERASWEMNGFFMIWLGTLVLALILPVKKAWQILLALTAVLLFTTPILNAITTERGLFISIKNADWLFVGFDLSFVSFGVLFLAILWHYRKSINNAKVQPNVKLSKSRTSAILVES